MSIIPISTGLDLDPPPGCTLVPRDKSLESLDHQLTYLRGRPDLHDLEQVWLPHSWNLAHPGSRPNPSVMSEESVRSLCLEVHAELVRQVKARPRCCVPAWPCESCP